MKKILFILLIVAGCLVLAACGTDNTETDDAVSGGDGEMNATVEQIEGSLYRYTVENGTAETLTFQFTSGQLFDYSLTNEAGEEVYLFSSTAMFTQALSEQTVGAGEVLTYDFEVPPLELEPGTYMLTAWLTPEEGPSFEAETTYEIE
ncbi:BsuPI-related putative proteinase inhibitor [Planomicrobium sp. YIM 101495]|uniref:BsuPI-related putative proteinase inhibitor n=1 Tax=Planomicrobium sp. YIM 101495 TaxID=2665160 RepID=UPI0012B71A9E|nr:BsuPI-related putative proteinase inhibitor [Planomicrobium sp. YIM 101495]MTD31287.1 intracellular proteinase inhibitor (BsuPI) [Planomicrobium sp. YIM 101495]